MDKLLDHQHEAHGVELGELPPVDRDHALHEGVLVIRILLKVVLDLVFEQTRLMAYLESIWQLAVLLEADLLLH